MAAQKPGKAGRKANASKALGDIMAGVMKKLGGPGRVSDEAMGEAWRKAAGGGGALHSRCVSFKRSSVFVNVDSSGWLYELTTRKREILAALEKELGGKKFRDIRFRIGEIKGADNRGPVQERVEER